MFDLMRNVLAGVGAVTICGALVVLVASTMLAKRSDAVEEQTTEDHINHSHDL